MRFRFLGASLVGALSFGIVAGCSHAAPQGDGSEDRGKTASATQAIQGGSDDGEAHPYAVGVCAGGAKGNCQGICSGALLLPNLVVTARHCVDATPKQIDCTANPPIRFGASEGVSWVTTNSKMFQSTLGWHHVKSIVVPTDDRVCGHDIALLILDTPIVNATEAVPVIPGVQYPMGDIDRYNHSFTAIGYGKISPIDPPNSAQCFTSASNYAICPGARRIRQNIGLLCIPGDEFIPCPAEAALNENEFIAGDGTCEGDSGSSAFETSSFQKGKPVSFGVLSRGGTSDDGTTCKQSIYSRLDKWRDLVVQAAQTASANWTLYPKPVPDWTIYVPPPVDAGPPEAGPPKKPSNLAAGVGCDENAECKSKVCADTGAGKACTIACDEAAPANCYEGMICKGSICVIDTGALAAPAATSSSTTTSGCSVGPSAPGSAGGRFSAGGAWGRSGVGIAALLGLFLGVRRRSKGRQAPVNP